MRPRSASLRDIDRNSYGEHVTRRPYFTLGADIDRIFRQAEQAQQQPRKDTTVDSPISGLSTPARVEQRIAQLASEGVTQLRRQDLRGMRPEQIERARQDGQLLQITSGLEAAGAAEKRAYQRGQRDTNEKWIKELQSDDD